MLLSTCNGSTTQAAQNSKHVSDRCPDKEVSCNPEGHQHVPESILCVTAAPDKAMALAIRDIISLSWR